mmetsp:Transcript_34878/g.58403  ORF Transcript_34878/g.58403 Transcript_34878/m.58403 type:complete len:93 (+) Transcript_34878:606-884(+)
MYDIDFSQKTAFLLGNELSGLSEEALSAVDGTFTIPLKGFSDSLNLGAAAAVILSHATHIGRRSVSDYCLTPAEQRELLLAWIQQETNQGDE